MREFTEEKLVSKKIAFVLVHGAWHSSATWSHISDAIQMTGYNVITLDLPGAGRYAKWPLCATHRPFDSQAYAEELSPNAYVTQDDRTQAVVNLLENYEDTENTDFILVGHSLGGITISAVAQALPHKIKALVYLCAYLVPPGATTSSIRQHSTMASSKIPGLQLANPAKIGALRINPLSEDKAYIDKLREAFAADLSAAEFTAELSQMHSDEPAQPVREPSTLTPERGGKVPRYYLRTLYDAAMPIAAQDYMIGRADSELGGKTQIYTLETGHTPQCTQPSRVIEILINIASKNTF